MYALIVQAVTWNAVLQLVSRSAHVVLAAAVYTLSSPTNFAIWAASNSLIYLTILWLDGGLRKSLPRYAPLLAAHPALYHAALRRLIATQSILILAACPCVCLYLFPLIADLSLPLRLTGTLLFCVEAGTSLLRLMYHAQLMHRKANTITACLLMLQTLLQLIFIFINHGTPAYEQCIIGLMLIQASSSALASILLWSGLQNCDQQSYNKPPQQLTLNYHQLWHNFLWHTAIMWLISCLKSLTERNFLFPFLLYTRGPLAATTFKLCHDATLFWYRTALKTIGTTDTSLMTYFHEQSPARLCNFLTGSILPYVLLLPISGIALIIIMISTTGLIHDLALPTLFLSIGALGELALSPYERLVEVAQQYRVIGCAYSIYCMAIVILILVYLTSTTLSLPIFIAWLVVIRLTLAMLMTLSVHQWWQKKEETKKYA